MLNEVSKVPKLKLCSITSCNYELLNLTFVETAAVSLWGRVVATHAGDWGSIPSRDRPKSLAQVLTAPLQNARNRCLCR